MVHAAPTQLRESLAARGRLAAEIAAFARSRGVDRPTVVCSWCTQVVHVGGMGPATHGICDRCEADLSQDPLENFAHDHQGETIAMRRVG